MSSHSDSFEELNEKYENLKDEMYWIGSVNYRLNQKVNDLIDENRQNQNYIEELKNINKQNQNYINELKNENKQNQNSINELKKENKQNQNNINELKKENKQNQNKINSMVKENDNLKQKIIQEENIKRNERIKFNNFKSTFEKDKTSLQSYYFENAKNYMINCIINEYVKIFEIEKENKSSFKKTLCEYMMKFTKEFMTYNQKFIQSFKLNSQTIIKNYNINDNNFSINHINFIVIGKAGTGKSAFINESLLLPIEKRAKEGDGLSVTTQSKLYTSEKLKMIRMWDTQGLDYKISQEYILKEVKKLVEMGLKNGADHYINIILYCTSGNRFQEEDGKLIYEIMKIYPMDNLPVIITQLQSYFFEDAKKMEIIIRDILKKYLDYKIVEKIQIKSVVSRDKKVDNIIFKAKGIPELLRCSFDIMGKAISSATFKKFSEDIEELCKKYVDEKIDFIQKIFIYEIEILKVASSMFIDEYEEYFKDNQKIIKQLSKPNIYNNVANNYFVNNFNQIMTYKFIEIYNNLNNTNISLNKREKDLVLLFIENRLSKLQTILNDVSEKIFQKIYKELLNDYMNSLRDKQSLRRKEYNINYDIIDTSEISTHYNNLLFPFFKNEFFKYFFCIILKLFMNYLKDILIENYRKELKENKEMEKIINDKAESSLKSVTQYLKKKLIENLDKYFPKSIKQREQREYREKREKKEKKNFDIDFEFPQYD